MREKQSTDTLAYKIAQYFYYFFVVNLYFVLSNSLILATLVLFPISISNILVYGIALIPTGASVTALFYTMGKLVRDKSIQPTSDYFKSYIKNFKDSTKYWLIVLIVLIILLVDILFVLSRGWTILTVISIILLLMIVLTGVYGFSLLSRFEVGLKNLLIFSVVLLYQNKGKTLSHLSYLITFSIILYGFANYAVLFIFSLFGFYIMRSNVSLLDKLEKEFMHTKEVENET